MAAIRASHHPTQVARLMVMRVMRANGKPVRRRGRRAAPLSLLAVSVLLVSCNLNPRPEDPGALSDDSPANGLGSGGASSAGAGGGGPVFGVGGAAGSTAFPNQPGADASASDAAATADGGPKDIPGDAAPTDGGASDAGDAAH